MKLVFRNLVAGLAGAATLLLAACGGGGGGDGDSGASRPTAVATASASSVPIGTAVTLDGSASSTPNGGSLTYVWTLAGLPANSAAALSSTSAVRPTFTPDLPGNYVADLLVRDGSAESEHARVTVTATTTVPVAVIAQPTRSVLRGLTVTLDGSASVPPTGAAASALSYEWTLTEQPEGSAATLNGANSNTATFLADAIGLYRATLIVRHGDKASPAAEARITVTNGNSSPVVSLNVPTTVVRGQTVTLDGSASSDPDGNPLHYRWFFPEYIANTGGPVIPSGSSATIHNHTRSIASFVADSAGAYHVDFTVYDGSVAATQRVRIVVTKPEGAPNVAPVAVIGTPSRDPAVTQLARGGSGSISPSNSYDVDGDPLTFKWTYWNVETPDRVETVETGGNVSGSSLQLPTTTEATYRVRLVANDGTADSSPIEHTVEVRTVANRRPSAVVSVAASHVLQGQVIEFDGSRSSDPDDDRLTYQWTLVDKPDGSNAVLQNATSEKSRVVADQPGIYTVWLRVTDPLGAANFQGTRLRPSAISVFAKAENNAPVVASAGFATISTPGLVGGDYGEGIAAGQAVALGVDNGASYLSPNATFIDPDNDSPLEYLVAVERQPAGSTFKDISANAQLVEGVQRPQQGGAPFIFTTAGDYTFSFIVNDGVQRSAPKTVEVPVVRRENYPSLLLKIGPPELPGPQLFFPYRSSGGYTNGEGFTVNTSYTLTAGDQAYTITDLQVSTTSGSASAVRLEGLQNGQVIPRGQSVTFTFSVGAGADSTLTFRVAERDGYTFSDNRYSR